MFIYFTNKNHLFTLHKRSGDHVLAYVINPPDGMYIMESEFRALLDEIEHERIIKFEANMKESKEACFPEIAEE